MKTLDQATLAFEAYKANYTKYISEDISESDTRSKLIDYLLKDVLGWEEQDIRREGKVESGYYDYDISIPGIFFIVEAKRMFHSIKLPLNHKKAAINSLYKGNKELFDQIRAYAIDHSVQYCVITNGYQFIIFRAININKTPWKDNLCMLFNGVDDIETRFIDFFENLSKYSLIHNGGFKFDLPIGNKEYKTVLSTLIDRDKELIRNNLSAKITPLIDKVFGEIFSEERDDDYELIRHCFVENKETKKIKMK